MKLIQLLSSALVVCTASARLDRRSSDFLKTTAISNTPATGPITANFISSQYGLDAPQLSAINSSSFDWWYFDVVSADLKTSLCIVFYTSLPTAFPFLPLDDVLQVGVYASFPNGTTTSAALNASEAYVVSYEEGSSGLFAGTGASWIGSGNDGVYSVQVDSPENGICGTFQLYAKAPAHYPCGPVAAGQNMMVGPNIGWSNAIPDAVGEVNFSIDGSTLIFSGAAYHDKNWSNQPFQDNVASWYWGHGTIGPYSVVWFDFLALNGTEYVSAYVALDDEIIVSSCTAGSIVVRPWGGDATYPPTVFNGIPAGFGIEIELPNSGSMTLNVTASAVVVQAETVYTRFLGSITGSVNGGTVMTGGVALFEQFKMTVTGV